jgi:hypothetical protein
MQPKNEVEVVEYTRDKKIADPNSLVLDGEGAVETPIAEITRKSFSWNRDRDCIVIEHQPAIAIYWNQDDGIALRQEDFFGDGSDIVIYFRPEHAERIANAILALAKRAR